MSLGSRFFRRDCATSFKSNPQPQKSLDFSLSPKEHLRNPSPARSPQPPPSPPCSPESWPIRSEKGIQDLHHLEGQYPDQGLELGPGHWKDTGLGLDQGRDCSRDDSLNPGNTLFVTGLSSRVTDRDLEEHFSKEGKVSSVFLVVEPRSRVSRGFAFVTMSCLEDADRCVKHLDRSVLEGRTITVEKSRRKRPRTPTPGHYLGVAKPRESDYRGSRYRGGGYGRDDYDYRRSPRRSPYRGTRGYSPRRSPYASRSRRDRSSSYSPYGSPDRGSSRRGYAR
ncbi:Serine/arginine-rich splicing factor SR45a-like protein [Drosera capensis]